MHKYDGVLTILGLARFCVLCVSVKVKLSVSLLRMLNLPFHYYVLYAFCLKRLSPKLPISCWVRR